MGRGVPFLLYGGREKVDSCRVLHDFVDLLFSILSRLTLHYNLADVGHEGGALRTYWATLLADFLPEKVSETGGYLFLHKYTSS